MRKGIVFLLLPLIFQIQLRAQEVSLLQSGHETSLRGLSVLNDSVAWVSGNKGWTAVSRDRGMTWTWKQIPGYENFDFRDIEAFSGHKAITVSAGTPAVILMTMDGGDTWKEVYRNAHPEIFLDGMDFWSGESGLIYGDPIESRMVLLRTNDGGKTWTDISSSNPYPLSPGEAGFAASGTGIRTLGKGSVMIATGGQRSSFFRSDDYGAAWTLRKLPMIQGRNSTGPFSIAFWNRRIGVAVGGDYLRDTLRERNILLTNNGGRSWREPKRGTGGYRSSVEFLSRKILVAAGTSGVDWSADKGKTWTALTKQGFHTVRRAKNGNWILMTGSEGRIAEIEEMP